MSKILAYRSPSGVQVANDASITHLRSRLLLPDQDLEFLVYATRADKRARR